MEKVPPIEQVRADVERTPPSSIRLEDLKERANILDQQDEDPYRVEMCDDLNDSCDRYLTAVLKHTHSADRARLTGDAKDKDREDQADQARRLTHNGLISRFQAVTRDLGKTDPAIAKWYIKNFHEAVSERDAIGAWALREALASLEQDSTGESSVNKKLSDNLKILKSHPQGVTILEELRQLATEIALHLSTKKTEGHTAADTRHDLPTARQKMRQTRARAVKLVADLETTLPTDPDNAALAMTKLYLLGENRD